MAATVQIRRITGNKSGPTSTDITSGSCHAGTEDTNTSPCNIPVPSSGSNYSYWISTQLNCTVAPDTQVDNIRWYTDGTNSLGTGVEAVVATASDYASAVGTAGSSGSVLNDSNYDSYLTSATASPMWQYTSDSSSKLTVAGSIGATTGCFGDWVVMQLQVESTAGAGNTSEETVTFQFDES